MDVRKALEQMNNGMGDLGSRIPDVMTSFGSLHHAATKDGALSAKHKELMALAIGIAVHCHYCILYHTAAALEAGATQQEIEEAIAVAILMGGGPAVAYGLEALETMKELLGG